MIDDNEEYPLHEIKRAFQEAVGPDWNDGEWRRFQVAIKRIHSQNFDAWVAEQDGEAK